MVKNALIGLVIVLAAGIIVSVFRGALGGSISGGSSSVVSITPIESVKPNDGLTQVLIDAVSSSMQNLELLPCLSSCNALVRVPQALL